MKIFLIILFVGGLSANYISDDFWGEVDKCVVTIEMYGIDSVLDKCIEYVRPTIVYSDSQDVKRIL